MWKREFSNQSDFSTDTKNLFTRSSAFVKNNLQILSITRPRGSNVVNSESIGKVKGSKEVYSSSFSFAYLDAPQMASLNENVKMVLKIYVENIRMMSSVVIRGIALIKNK